MNRIEKSLRSDFPKGRFLCVSLSLLLFSSCSNYMAGTLKKGYPPSEEDAPVVIYQQPNQVPVESECLGELKARSIKPLSSIPQLDSTSILSLMKDRTRTAGGNALLITEIKQPSKYSTALKISTKALRVTDFSSPPDTLQIPRKPATLPVFRKGTWNLHLSVSFLQKYLFHPDGENYKNSTGIFGAGIGVAYYHRDNQFASLQVEAMTNSVPRHGEFDEEEDYYSIYTTLTNNHVLIKRFTLGYGLSLSHYLWRYYDHRDWIYDEEDPNYYNQSYGPDKKSAQTALGLALSGQYHFTNWFNIGVMYCPSFVRFHSKETFDYAHTISCSLIWKIRLK